MLSDGVDGAGLVVTGSVDSAGTDGRVVAGSSSADSVSDSWWVLSEDTASVCSTLSC